MDDVAVDAGRRRRPAPRAARRAGPVRRRSCVDGSVARRHLAAHRRADAGRARRPGIACLSGSLNLDGPLVRARDRAGRREPVRADRRARALGAGAARRRSSGWPIATRSGSPRHAGRRAPCTCVASGRPRARARRARRRDALPADPRHAGRDHRRHQSRRAPADHRPPRRRARAARPASTAAIFDKTGTLTVGTPEVRSVIAARRFTRRRVLRLAAAVEQGSGHLLARSVVEAAESRGLELSPVPTLADSSSPRDSAAFTTERASRCPRAPLPAGAGEHVVRHEPPATTSLTSGVPTVGSVPVSTPP